MLKTFSSIKPFLILFFPLLSIFLFSTEFVFSISIGVVDMEYIFIHYEDVQEMEIALMEIREEYQLEIDEERERIEEFEAQITRERPGLSENEYNQRLLELELLKSNLEVLIEELNQDLIELEEELKAPILQRISRAIEIVREEEELDIILNSNDLLAWDREFDVSNRVLETLILEEEMEAIH